MQSRCHHSPFPSTKSLLKLSWNVMECLPTIPSPIPLSTNIARWAVNGANVEITSTCAYMCQNLTWLDKTHAFTVWEGFKAQGCMSCPHNLWDHPCLHQCSSWSLIVIICHSHQQNLCLNSFVMEHLPTSPSPMPLSTDVTRWAMNRSNIEIPSTCAYMHRNVTLLDKTCAFTVWEGLKA